MLINGWEDKMRTCTEVFGIVKNINHRNCIRIIQQETFQRLGDLGRVLTEPEKKKMEKVRQSCLMVGM